MNLETSISEPLWAEIQQHYTEGRFTDSIKDAILHLSNVIREKANLEGDGHQLIGEAFGGVSPKIRVTKLQSENDKNIQKGIADLLRGIYSSIRNPRNHEKYTDSQQDADAIILFVDYLLRTINLSKAQFTLDTFLPRVFDGSFVESQKYAELLTSEIPERRRMEVMLAMLEKKEQADGKKFKLFFQSLFSSLNQSDKAEILQKFSEEPQLCDKFYTIRSIVQILDPADWPKLQMAARMRIENKFIDSIKEGAYNPATARCTSGALGAWSTGLFPYFTLKSHAASAITGRLLSESNAAKNYARNFFAGSLPDLLDAPTEYIKKHFIERLTKGDSIVFEFLNGTVFCVDDDHAWAKAFKPALDKFEPAQKASLPEAPPAEDDEVPF